MTFLGPQKLVLEPLCNIGVWVGHSQDMPDDWTVFKARKPGQSWPENILSCIKFYRCCTCGCCDFGHSVPGALQLQQAGTDFNNLCPLTLCVI